MKSARLLALILLVSLALGLLAQESAPTAELVTTIETKEDLPIVAAWAPDGKRLAYGTEKQVRRRSFSARESFAYPGEVWVAELDGDRDRILKHDFMRNRRGDFFSFSVERLNWSPTGTRLAVELRDEEKNTATFLLTDGGKKIEIGDSGRNFLSGYGGAWLGDSQTVALLREVLAPRLLHQVFVVRVKGGRTIPLFEHSSFAAVAWLPRTHRMVGVERERDFARTPRLVLGDLQSGQTQLLSELGEGYVGGLQASPDEGKISYFVAQEKLAVQGLQADNPVEHWPVPFGKYEWIPGREAVLFIEPEELGRRSGWLTLYDHAQGRKSRVLAQEKIQDFWVSPDGGHVAVLTVGLRPQLRIYRLPLP